MWRLLIVVSLSTTLVYGNVTSSPAPQCVYPCMGMDHGCQCSQSDTIHDKYGQTYGTCTNCTRGWQGNDCMTQDLPCQHGALPITVNNTQMCQCPDRFMGSNCADPRCAHGANGPMPSSVNNECPSCQQGFEGLQCTMCADNSNVCGDGNVCNTSLIPNNVSKTLECDISSKPFMYLLGDGRPNVSGIITVDCTSPADDGGLLNTNNGTCTMSLFRRETNDEWLDEYFWCYLTGVSANLTDSSQGSSSVANAGGVASTADSWRPRRIVYIVFLMICGVTVLVNGAITKTARRRTLLFNICGALMGLGLLVFIVDAASHNVQVLGGGFGGGGSAPTPQIVYRFEQSQCQCAANPPNSKYTRYCSRATFGQTILPSLHRWSELRCDLDGSNHCEFYHSQLPMKIALTCKASECVGKDAAVTDPPYLIVTHYVMEGWIVTFVLLGVFLIGYYVYGRYILHLRAKEFKDLYESVVDPDDLELEDTIQLTLENIDYVVKVEDEEQRILKSVSMYAQSGKVLAIMGPSGAGKTTVLDIIGTREKSGTLSGKIIFNGHPLATKEDLLAYKSIVAFVAQEDYVLPTLTVYDSVHYVTQLVLPAPISSEGKAKVTNWALKLLGLEGVSQRVIGSTSSRGISGGERRRVSIAMALVSNPHVLLLDEPTSGLDSYSALQVVRAIANLKQSHHPLSEYSSYFNTKPMVVMSIHQPSREVFEALDSVLLLSAGVVLFQGHPKECVTMFERFSERPIRSDENPADYVLTVAHDLDEEQRNQVAMLSKSNTRGWGSNSSHSTMPITPEGEEATSRFRRTHMAVMTEIEMGDSPSALESDQLISRPAINNNNSSTSKPNVDEKTTTTTTSPQHIAAKKKKYALNVYQQARVLLSRSLRHLMGSYHLVACHTGVTVILSFFLSIMYEQQSLDLPGTLNRAGCITFVLLVLAFSSLSSLELFLVDKTLFLNERDNGHYTTAPYFFTKIFLDLIPLRLFPTLFLGCFVYYPMGLRTDEGSYFLWFLFTLVVFNCVTSAQCMCIAMVVPSFGTGALISALWMLWEFVFGGLMVQAKTIPTFLQPFRMMSPFFLAFESLIVNELDGQTCVFAPTDAANRPTGYSVPLLCRQYLSNLSLEPLYFTRDELLLCCWSVIYVVIALLLLMFVVKQKR